MPDFKYIVVGAGMMGAAAARHLSVQTDGVALIGPDEPADRKTHQGVFSSHYDEARITRGFAPAESSGGDGGGACVPRMAGLSGSRPAGRRSTSATW